MELPEEKVKFVVGLSNGETLTEGKGVLAKDGTLSPWHKLQAYLKEKDLEIRSMSLYSKTEVGNRHYHLPNDPDKWAKFNKWKKGEVPVSYRCFRGVESDWGKIESTSVYTCAEATYENFKVQLYVSEADPDKVWVNIINNKNGSSI